MTLWLNIDNIRRAAKLSEDMIMAAETLEELEQVRRETIGKNGWITVSIRSLYRK